jgi:hypothetical protein
MCLKVPSILVIKRMLSQKGKCPCTILHAIDQDRMMRRPTMIGLRSSVYEQSADHTKAILHKSLQLQVDVADGQPVTASCANQLHMQVFVIRLL